MAIWIAILLGLVQGLTEFLPVSSSGHLLMFQRFFKLDDVPLLFDIILHVATLCAVVIVFRKKIWELICKPFCKMTYCLVITTAISCALVLIFNQLFDLTRSYKILPITFLSTAIILFATTLFPKKERGKDNKEDGKESSVEYKTGIVAGVAQGVAAVIPGISRSGSTIAASLATGVKREEAAEFAFLMSIPIIIASFVFELISSPDAISAVQVWPLLFGFVTAMIAGIFAINVMLKIVKNIKLYWFSIYLVVLSVVLMFVFYL